MTSQQQTAQQREITALAVSVAGRAEEFVGALRAIAREAQPGEAVPLLLLQVSQVLLAGAQLGASADIAPAEEFQPDVGPESDADDLRLGLAELLGNTDTYSFVFDPYQPEIVVSQISDDLSSVATDLENGLRHYRNGDVREALWWWQFSYVSSWGNLAGAVLNALLTVVAHDRLDAELVSESDQVAAADEMLREGD